MINVLTKDELQKMKYDIRVTDSYAYEHSYYNVRYNFIGEKQFQVIGDNFVDYYMLDNVVQIHIKDVDKEEDDE